MVRQHIWMNAVRIGVAHILVLLVAVCVYKQISIQKDSVWYTGKGTRELPYKITSAQDLAELASAVNAGNTFERCYFIQTNDIDLSYYDNWMPIGISDGDYAFAGIYDGNGHTITNLSIDGTKLSNGNVGLFGKLGGVVCNLGIESGEIYGECVGGITSSSDSADAMVINCYNKASLSGHRCGGIADNFGSGTIIACYNEGTLTGDVTGDIVSYTADTIYGCYGLNGLTNENFRGKQVSASEVCGKIEKSKICERIREAEYLFDLQNLKIVYFN